MNQECRKDVDKVYTAHEPPTKVRRISQACIQVRILGFEAVPARDSFDLSQYDVSAALENRDAMDHLHQIPSYHVEGVPSLVLLVLLPQLMMKTSQTQQR